MRIKTTGLFALATMLLVGVSSSAHAQAAICYDLETRLASLQRGGAVSNGGRSKSNTRAVQKLRKQIAGAQAGARKAGCRVGGIRLFQKRECRSRNSSIKQLTRNLQKLQRQGGRSAAPSRRNVNRQKQELIVALGRHRCGAKYERAAAKYNGQRGIFGRKKALDGFNEPQVRSYRTVCVRTCDGFFFPISHSTTSRAFARDEAVCKGKFPNTDVSLFYHPRGVTNAMERARSIDGQSYAAMPYAFRYQKKYDNTCTFDRSILRQTAGIIAVSTGDAPQDPRFKGLKFGQNGPVPERRPEIGLDPETAMNVAGYLRPKALPLPPELVGDTQIKDGQRVRLVGPEVFYGQSTAEVLSSPARTRVQ